MQGACYPTFSVRRHSITILLHYSDIQIRHDVVYVLSSSGLLYTFSPDLIRNDMSVVPKPPLGVTPAGFMSVVEFA